jgi:hypothetical protein
MSDSVLGAPGGIVVLGVGGKEVIG